MNPPTEPKRRGRPPLAPGQSKEMPVRTIRLSDEQWRRFCRMGGPKWLRQILALYVE